MKNEIGKRRNSESNRSSLIVYTVLLLATLGLALDAVQNNLTRDPSLAPNPITDTLTPQPSRAIIPTEKAPETLGLSLKDYQKYKDNLVELVGKNVDIKLINDAHSDLMLIEKPVTYKGVTSNDHVISILINSDLDEGSLVFFATKDQIEKNPVLKDLINGVAAPGTKFQLEGVMATISGNPSIPFLVLRER